VVMPRNVLIAPDSFKGSCPAADVARAMKEGLARAWPDAEFDLVPMSDGGDGFVDAMLLACGGHAVEVPVRGPLGAEVQARYGVTTDGVAVIEMAEASGLRLLSPDELDPLRASTYGTGQLIKAAIERGARELIVGVGGSATNDGGAGMAEALGVVFRDSRGRVLSGCPVDLASLDRVDLSNLHPAIKKQEVSITVACDVSTVLCGPSGASHVFGPQKGASKDTVELLDSILVRYADIVESATGRRARSVSGSGAAGGLAFGLVAFLGASMKCGFETVSNAARLHEKISRADIVFTGEGRTDDQSRLGKTIFGVVDAAVGQGIPVVVISGSLQQCEFISLAGKGQVAFASIAQGPVTLGECMAKAVPMLEAAAFRTARTIDVGLALAARRGGTLGEQS